eukprot:scaffold109621_cov14-Tisochrysis_lutea.AAC.1
MHEGRTEGCAVANDLRFSLRNKGSIIEGGHQNLMIRYMLLDCQDAIKQRQGTFDGLRKACLDPHKAASAFVLACEQALVCWLQGKPRNT